MKKSILPPIDLMSCDKGSSGKRVSTAFSVQHHLHQPWYASVAGILFFMTMIILFSYVVATLNVIGEVLRRGENMSAAEFRQVYQVDRDTLQNQQQLFITLLVFMTIILAILIWTSLPQRVKCGIFNQYTMVLFFFFVLVVSSWSDANIAHKAYVKPTTNVLNGVAIAFTSIFLIVYALYTMNYHLELVKLS